MGVVVYTKRFRPDGLPLLVDDELIDLEPKIYRYHSHYRPSLYFCGARDNGNNLFLGFELEFDTRKSLAARRSNKMDIIEKSNRLMGNNTDIYYMNDGSLTNGLEMISQPATYEFHVKRYDVYKELFDYIKEHGFGSQSFQTCGLHIHFNRSFYKEDEDTFTTNLISLVNKFWRDLVLISRRKYDKVVKWANKYKNNPDYIVDRYKKNILHDRYKAINLTNEATIEFRIYRGTLDIDDFMAILEITRNIIMAAKKYSPEEIENLKWENFITSRNLLKYNNKCHRKSQIDKLPDELRK